MTDKLPAIRFDHESVRVFAPAKRPTVYEIISWDDRSLYIGASVTPRNRLHEHLRDGRFDGDGAFVRFRFCRNPTAMAKLEAELLATQPGELNFERGKLNGAWGARRVRR